MQQLSTPFSTLLNQLADPSSQIRVQAIKSIVARPAERKKAFVPLLALLADPDEQVLKTAITALGTLGNRQVIPVLIQIIAQHPLARVRLRALKTLGKISSSEALSPTLSALHDSSSLVRRAAIGMVGRWKKPYTVRLLLALLSDPNAAVRARASEVLRQFAALRIVDPLLATLDNAAAYNERGNIYRQAGLYDQAIADFTQATQLEPTNASAYYDRGRLYYHDLQQYEQALYDFEQAVQLRPGLIRARFERGSTCFSLQRYDQALTDFNHVIEANEETYLTAWAYLRRGLVSMQKQEYQLAIADFERATECDPCKASAYNNLGCVHHFLGDYQLAIGYYTRALALEPAKALYYSNRGEAYQCLAQFKQAIADFELALLLKPDLSEARDFLEKAKEGKQ